MHTDSSPMPVMASNVSDTPWYPWHSMQACNSASSKGSAMALSRKNCSLLMWHVPHTWLSDVTPGGVAPWLPWQSLQAGAPVSWSSRSFVPWTLLANWLNWLVGMGYSCMYSALPWMTARAVGDLFVAFLQPLAVDADVVEF